jgi:hypothetical protein
LLFNPRGSWGRTDLQLLYLHLQVPLCRRKSIRHLERRLARRQTPQEEKAKYGLGDLQAAGPGSSSPFAQQAQTQADVNVTVSHHPMQEGVHVSRYVLVDWRIAGSSLEYWSTFQSEQVPRNRVCSFAQPHCVLPCHVGPSVFAVIRCSVSAETLTIAAMNELDASSLLAIVSNLDKPADLLHAAQATTALASVCKAQYLWQQLLERKFDLIISAPAAASPAQVSCNCRPAGRPRHLYTPSCCCCSSATASLHPLSHAKHCMDVVWFLYVDCLGTNVHKQHLV